MSAITGIFHLNGQPVDSLRLERMTAALAHRGPDGSGIWSKGPVGLGHNLLRVTPESLDERMPVSSLSGEIVLTADARVDNRDELFDHLDIGHSSAEDVTDSRLILAAYEKWGENCPEKLLGDFAFAIWDERKQMVFCARDHVGVKPFYYYLSGDIFAFASEIKALLCLSEVPCRINEARMADHLLNGFEDKTSTLYEGIYRLTPAHSFTVGRGASRLRRYWSLDPSREIRLRSDDEYAEAFRDVFARSVACRLRSAFPVGASLSGGLDSSSIACAARNVMGESSEQLHTFSAIFPSLPKEDMSKIDERAYMDSVLALGRFIPHAVEADRVGPLSDIDEILWHEDEAVLAPNLYIHWALYGAARRAGVRVFLDGLDGDSTVSHGLDYLGELARRGRWLKLYSESSALSRKTPNASFTARWIFWEYGIKNAIPERALEVLRAIRGTRRTNSNDHEIVNPDFAQRVGLSERARKMKQIEDERLATVREGHLRSLDAGLIPYTLELADKAGAAFQLEPRYPFFDRRLMEFCLALPSDQKLNKGWTRVVMRRAMEGILPREVQWRIGKANLSPNFRRGLLDLNKPVVDDVIEKGPHAIQKYFDMSTLRASYNRYQSRSGSSNRDSLTIYKAVMLGRWLQKTNFDTTSGLDRVLSKPQWSDPLSV